MKKPDLGQSIGILANLGVVAGIVFLGIEISQNTRSQQAATYQDLARLNIEMNNEVMLTRPELDPSRISREAFQLASPEEQRQMRAIVGNRFIFADLAYYQFELGALTDERLEAVMDAILAIMCSSWLYREIWSDFKEGEVDGFRNYIDAKVEQC